MSPVGSTTKRGDRLIDKHDMLRARLRAAPEGPGVYVLRGADTRVIYVGKAASLRNRLRSWFTGVDSLESRTRGLVERVFDFDVIASVSEREALILENTLIKQYRPRYNVRLKDDKSYLYLKIPRPGVHDAVAPGTAREEVRKPRGKSAEGATLFPRPYYTRKVIRDGARYFGPYTSAQSLRTTVKSLRTIFPFRTCSDEIFRRGRVCLDYHIKRCSGPCEGRIDEPQYAHLLDEVQLFMDGRSESLQAELNEQMDAAAARQDYELAARNRDRLRAIDRITERQTVLRGSRADEDCVAVALEGGRAMAAVLTVRQGRVVATETHELEGVTDLDAAACLAGFLPQYYTDVTSIPRRVLLSHEVEDVPVIADFLSLQREGPVDVHVPQRGDARRLVERASETALVTLRQKRIVDDFDAAKTEALLDDLASRLRLSAPAAPHRVLRHQQHDGHELGGLDDRVRGWPSRTGAVPPLRHQDGGGLQRLRVDGGDAAPPLSPADQTRGRRRRGHPGHRPGRSKRWRGDRQRPQQGACAGGPPKKTPAPLTTTTS